MKVRRRPKIHPVGHAARREQFELLYRTHVRSLLAYALRRVDHAEDAADVVAETMLIAWRRQNDVNRAGDVHPDSLRSTRDNEAG